MAREIKFREWDKYRGTLSYGEREDFDDMVGFRFEHTENIDGDLSKERVLEQYTGVNDRNDVKIYENDIVQMEYTAGHHESWDMSTFAKTEDYNDVDTYVRGIARIYASKGVVLVNLIPDDIEQFSDEHKVPKYINVTKYCSVLGNIHENPELLEEK
jgi:uncharacterized phage protein (TIGR01671 family)